MNTYPHMIAMYIYMHDISVLCMHFLNYIYRLVNIYMHDTHVYTYIYTYVYIYMHTTIPMHLYVQHVHVCILLHTYFYMTGLQSSWVHIGVWVVYISSRLDILMASINVRSAAMMFPDCYYTEISVSQGNRKHIWPAADMTRNLL